MAAYWIDRATRPGVLRCLYFCILFILLPLLLLPETFKLYLKDGDYQMVREYQILEDRVRYYSTERGEWEEIPKDMIDFNKTEGERKKVRQAIEKDAQLLKAENQYERTERKEVASIPPDAGAYFVEAGKVRTIEPADWKVEGSSKRKVLQMITPVPMVAGKATVTVKGEHSNFVVHNTEPEFYVRLDQLESFGIIRLTPKKDQRIVENVSIVPVTKENIEEQKQVETYQREMSPGLYKIWPAKALEPGEYALVQYTTGQLNLQVWDFSVSPDARADAPASTAAAPAPSKTP